MQADIESELGVLDGGRSMHLRRKLYVTGGSVQSRQQRTVHASEFGQDSSFESGQKLVVKAGESSQGDDLQSGWKL